MRERSKADLEPAFQAPSPSPPNAWTCGGGGGGGGDGAAVFCLTRGKLVRAEKTCSTFLLALAQTVRLRSS